MKSIFLLISLFIFSLPLFAETSLGFGDGETFKAKKYKPTPFEIAQDQIADYFMSIEGVNSANIKTCTPPGDNKENSPCVEIGTVTKSAYNKLIRKYPPGSKAHGFYITLMIEEPIRAQKGVSLK